jgi:hypothetical protein
LKIFNSIRWIIAFGIFSRILGVITCGDPGTAFYNVAHGKIKVQVQNMLAVNNDELIIGETALNHHYGLSYASSLEAKRGGYVYDFTAYRPSYHVYLHIFLMESYFKIFPSEKIALTKTDPYFLGFAFMMQVISLLLFCISLFYFRKIALFFLDGIWPGVALVFYSIYPSVIFYVGNQVNFESITASLLIINMAIVLKACNEKISRAQTAAFICSFLLSVLFRPQQVFIYLFVFGIYFLSAFLKRKTFACLFSQSLKLTAACCLSFMLFNVPVVIKNHRLFGAWVLANNGALFNYGHNPYARGSWCGTCEADTGSSYYKYVRQNIAGYDRMNEYEKSESCKRLGWQWIKGNLPAEMKLAARKAAIYFLPFNNDHNVFNPLNLFVHAGTLIFIFYMLYRILITKELDWKYFLLSAPLAGSLAVSIFFFVGYRWRYYAEPFMVIMTVIMIEKCWRRLAGRKL